MRPTLTAIATAALVLSSSLPAGSADLRAHEEAVIEGARSALPAGGVLEISGKDFTGGESYALRLVGALREYELGDVEPGEDGTFRLDLEIPRPVKPGAYQLVAVAGDGDEVARYDLRVLAPDPSAEADAGGERSGPVSGGSAARTDDIQLERRRSGLEWGVIGLLIGLAGGLGVGLLRRERAAPGG